MRHTENVSPNMGDNTIASFNDDFLEIQYSVFGPKFGPPRTISLVCFSQKGSKKYKSRSNVQSKALLRIPIKLQQCAQYTKDCNENTVLNQRNIISISDVTIFCQLPQHMLRKTAGAVADFLPTYQVLAAFLWYRINVMVTK